LRNIKTFKKVITPGPYLAYYERICTKGMNHSLQLTALVATGKIHLIKMSLDVRYTKYLEVNFVQNSCSIILSKANELKYIDIPKMIDLDFPLLDKVREKVDMYITFS